MDPRRDADWERSKENIQPLRGGRLVGEMNEALRTADAESLRLAKEKFERNLKEAEMDQEGDRLDSSYKYMCWFEQHFPSGKEKEMRNILESILTTFGENQRYDNDPRMMKTYCRYAKLSQSMGPRAVLEQVFNSGKCRKLADFFLQWAETAEASGDVEGTRGIFMKGLDNGAEPVAKIQAAIASFEERNKKRQEDLSRGDDEIEPTRVMLGLLRPVGRDRHAPVVRASSGVAPGIGQQQQFIPKQQKNQRVQNFEVFPPHNDNIPSSTAPSVSIVRSIEQQRQLEAKENENEGKRSDWLTKETTIKKKVSESQRFEIYEDRKEPSRPSLPSQTRKSHPNASIQTNLVVPVEFLSEPALSFEEALARRYTLPDQKGKTTKNMEVDDVATQSPIRLGTSSTSHLGRPPLPPKDLGRTALTRRNSHSEYLGGGGGGAGTSFTANLQRETLAFLSNTIPLHASSDPAVDQTETESAPPLPPAKMERFEIYMDKPEDKIKFARPSAVIKVINQEKDKVINQEKDNKPSSQNGKPTPHLLFSGAASNPLCSRAMENENAVESKDTLYEQEPQRKRSSSNVVSEASLFDGAEETLAGCGRPAKFRLASTPAHTFAAPITFAESTLRWDAPMVQPAADFEFMLAPPSQPAGDFFFPLPASNNQQSSTNEHTTNGRTNAAVTMTEDGRRLSVIQESSREFHSGSSGLTSLAKTPKTPATMPLIAEVSSMRDQDELEHAVRRLSLAGSDNGIRDEVIAGMGTTENAWNKEMQTVIMNNLKTPVYLHELPGMAPKMKIRSACVLSGDEFRVLEQIGKGAFATVYRCQSIDENTECAIKVQSPPCPWEVYMCNELLHRIPPQQLPTVMNIREAYIFQDTSFIVYDYHGHGTLLDVRNRMIEKRTELHEFIIVYLALQMINIMETVHAARIIHSDLKPDNFLVIQPYNHRALGRTMYFRIDATLRGEQLLSTKILKLIDWGRAIDMDTLGQRYFHGRTGTSAFECPEMLDGRPWNYHADYFGFIATMHVIMMGQYMTIWLDNGAGIYRMATAIRRRWMSRTLFDPLFYKLLNLEMGADLPSWGEIRAPFESFLLEHIANDDHEWRKAVEKFNSLLVFGKRTL